MPRSRSSSFESMTRSATVSFARNVPLWRSMASTSVVLPWSTWAMIAMLRRLGFKQVLPDRLLLTLYYAGIESTTKTEKSLLRLVPNYRSRQHRAVDHRDRAASLGMWNSRWRRTRMNATRTLIRILSYMGIFMATGSLVSGSGA